MLFTSKTNTTATENTEESQSTGKMGILKNIAIIAGTAAGIGGVVFGAKKLHDHFSQEYLEDFDDDFDDFFEDEVEDAEPETAETSEETSEEATVNKDDRDADRLVAIENKLRTFQFTYPESLDSFLKKLDDLRQPMYDLVYMMKDSVVGLSDYNYCVADNIKEHFNVELSKLVRACDTIVVSTGDQAGLAHMRDYLKKLDTRTGFIMTPDVYSRLKNLQSLVVVKLAEESKKSENETQVSEKTAAEVMDGCEAIIDGLGGQSDAVPSNFAITHSIKILNDVYTKYPSWKDLKALPQDVVDTVNAADSCLSHSIGAVKRNIAVRMNGEPDVNELNKMHESLTKILTAINNAENLKKRSSLDGYKSDMIILKSRINSRIKHIKESGETQTDSKSAGENQTAENCFDAFKPEHKETNKVEGETKTSTEPLTYTMAEKVADAVKAGDEIQAPVAATASEKEAQEIMRIINDIPNRQTPEKNDLRFLARCIGGHVVKIDTSDVSDEMLADLRNSVIVFSGMIYTAIEHIVADPASDVFTLGNVQQMRDEFAASNILELIGKDTAKTMLQSIDEEIAAFTEKIKSAKAETAAAQEPEEPAGLPVDITSEMDELGAKLKEAGNLIKAEKWSDAKEFYKSQLTPYLADENLSADLRDQISAISTKATNMLAGQKQLERKKEAEAKKSGNRKSGKKARRSKR